jgi:hypothetical protein
LCSKTKKEKNDFFTKKMKNPFFLLALRKEPHRSPLQYARRYFADALYVQRRWVCFLPAPQHLQA